jgi:hypothetical protein
VQALSNTSLYKALYVYIDGVLSVTRSADDFGLFANSSTGKGILNLGTRFFPGGLSVKGDGYLIDTIIGSGNTTIIQ